jgi:nitrite reductase (NO-forming)
MMHSMDFHAAMVAPQDKHRSIAPGQTIEFEFVLNYPGVFMYHCGTPMVLEHIASGPCSSARRTARSWSS